MQIKTTRRQATAMIGRLVLMPASSSASSASKAASTP